MANTHTNAIGAALQPSPLCPIRVAQQQTPSCADNPTELSTNAMNYYDKIIKSKKHPSDLFGTSSPRSQFSNTSHLEETTSKAFVAAKAAPYESEDTPEDLSKDLNGTFAKNHHNYTTINFGDLKGTQSRPDKNGKKPAATLPADGMNAAVFD